jgi:hypothetical protein
MGRFNSGGRGSFGMFELASFPNIGSQAGRLCHRLRQHSDSDSLIYKDLGVENVTRMDRIFEGWTGLILLAEVASAY